MAPANTLEAIRYDPSKKTLDILDQLLLPHQTVYVHIRSVQDGWTAIRSMQVRGAPAIAIVAMLSLCVELYKLPDNLSAENLLVWIMEQLEYLKTSRPTAVNLFDACGRSAKLLTSSHKLPPQEVKKIIYDFAEELLRKDVEDNKHIGKYGAEFLLKSLPDTNALTVLTHCNTGSLATAGYGTALGIIRSLNEHQSLRQVICTETRPYNQGSRLTAFELVTDELPGATLITDSMASFLMKTKKESEYPVNAVIVGADRVAANGDTANKIGTYQLAIAAKYHGALFIVAAPSTSIDLSLPDGSRIPVEERNRLELTQVKGYSQELDQHVTVSLAPDTIDVWNPGFG